LSLAKPAFESVEHRRRLLAQGAGGTEAGHGKSLIQPGPEARTRARAERGRSHLEARQLRPRQQLDALRPASAMP
jgi:hypothetical protein